MAYNDSEDWLDAVIDYIHGNYKYVKEYFKRELPAIGIHELEATYLVWMDFRSLDLTLDELTEVIFKDAKWVWTVETGSVQRVLVSCG